MALVCGGDASAVVVDDVNGTLASTLESACALAPSCPTANEPLRNRKSAQEIVESGLSTEASFLGKLHDAR